MTAIVSYNINMWNDAMNIHCNITIICIVRWNITLRKQMIIVLWQNAKWSIIGHTVHGKLYSEEQMTEYRLIGQWKTLTVQMKMNWWKDDDENRSVLILVGQ